MGNVLRTDLLADLPNYRAQQSRERFHLSNTHRAQCRPRVATQTGCAHGCDHCTRQPDELPRPAVGGCSVRWRDARHALLDGRSRLCACGTRTHSAYFLAAHSLDLLKLFFGWLSGVDQWSRVNLVGSARASATRSLTKATT
jgi:hypothetical protein